jgi:hypothetical protein
MKKLYPLLSVLFLIYWGCDDPKEEDTTPPTVSIQSPITNQSINEIVTILVETNDNEGINRVEFYIDDSLFFTDLESPYEYEWNTTQYDDNSEHIVKVISYDNSDNSTTSQPIMLTVDNSISYPNGVNVSSVTYTITEMTVEWEESTDGDFKDYKLLYSETEIGVKDTLETYTDISTTSYTITEFDPLVENWFWVQVLDTMGLSSIGTGMTNEIESIPPTSSELYPITYNDGFQISWSQNNDDDFVTYKLYESLSEDMSNWTLVYETNDRTNTSFDLTLEVLKYYQIVVEDVWGLQSTSNIEVGDYEVELWGEYYSVLNTTELVLINDGLTGSIPPEIGNLTNLTLLNLHENQLTGEIPSEIGNLTNLTDLYLYSNQLSGIIPLEIWNLTNLEGLVLDINELTGSIPPEIGNLTNLTHLILDFNQLTGEIPPEIGNLTNLTYLSLSGNQLTGSIPPEIGNLTNLERLYLHYNQLTGSIPPEIGNLTNLTGLRLSWNELTGSIPPEIGNLTNLTSLNLSYNQLTGEIPESICDFNIIWSSSWYFSISNNQFCPPYPSCIEDYVGTQDTSDCD